MKHAANIPAFPVADIPPAHRVDPRRALGRQPDRGADYFPGSRPLKFAPGRFAPCQHTSRAFRLVSVSVKRLLRGVWYAIGLLFYAPERRVAHFPMKVVPA